MQNNESVITSICIIFPFYRALSLTTVYFNISKTIKDNQRKHLSQLSNIYIWVISILFINLFFWGGASLVAQTVKNLPAVQETLGQEDHLERE